MGSVSVVQKRCEVCGKYFGLGYCSTICRACRFKKGEIWVLHMTENIDDEWEWTKIEK